MSPIALLTDFGLQDGYVGILKGVIASLMPQVAVVDISHEIPPQNLWAARFCLANALPYFPDGTIAVAVVDPGVGGDRRAVAIQTERGWLVGPDNGIWAAVLQRDRPVAAVVLTNSTYWREATPSHTFHGRDIFAPVAAHLARGVAIAELGEPIDPVDLQPLPLPPVHLTWSNGITQSLANPSPTDTVTVPIPAPATPDLATGTATDPVPVHLQSVTATVQHCDRFGNLITTVPGSVWRSLPDRCVLTWMTPDPTLAIPWVKTYDGVATGAIAALIGSHGWLELAVREGSAAAMLGLTWGDSLTLAWREAGTWLEAGERSTMLKPG
jgi:S-adenosylmethionine hydrolase